MLLNQVLAVFRRRIIDASRHSVSGIASAIRSEEALRVELLFAVVLAPVSFLIASSAVELIALLGSLFLVVLMELINTAIEVTIDRIGTEVHDLSKKAKDIGSALVLLSIAHFLIVWLSLIWNPWR